ncbi:hypothetical protein JRO89_XS12G0136200 [Xanthoceras sorbifolium]|uniref:Uncharacterized protein n=1 Tax=Xanthoceras sorbifolium TaxID=99658 RepID=A0ABQ8HCJ8_9ROSI|nr:hypothetical protein JRO89_XS12G0136200 [Xanthoceras sorbifolium]
MGHVDAGKTKLLDFVRGTNVLEGEAGFLTQQIGATYFPAENIRERTKELKADAKMKVPVVDIMEGLKPQTIESLNLLKMRNTEFIVALNKKAMVEKLTFSNEVQCTVLEVKVIEGHGTTIDVVLVDGVIHEGDQIVGTIITTIRALLTPHPMKELRVKLFDTFCYSFRLELQYVFLKGNLLILDEFASIENNRKPVEIAKKGQKVSVKIVGSNPEEQQKMFGRHFDLEDELVSHISRRSIDDDLSLDERKLVVKLKNIFKIQ